MGKGGGKCSSKENCESSIESMTPKSKTHHGHHQFSTKAKGLDRVVHTDSNTSVPFIPKKMKSSQPQMEEDETIDTNVMFDQQEPQSNVSEFGKRLLGPPSFVVESAPSTLVFNPICTFSSVNGQSFDSPDELQHVQISTSHPKHLQVNDSMPHQQEGEIGSSSQSSFDSTLPSLQDDNDLFPTKDIIIPSHGGNSTTIRHRHHRKKWVSNASPSKSKGILTTSTKQLPTIGATGEKSFVPILTNLQTSPKLVQAPLSPRPNEDNDVIKTTTPQGHKVELKEVVDTQALLMSKYFRGRLNDSWDLMPQQHGLGSFSPMLVTMPELVKAKTNVNVDPHVEVGARRIGDKNVHMVTKKLKESKVQVEEEAKSQLSTNDQQEEPLDLVEMKNKTLLVEFVIEGTPIMEFDPKQLQSYQPLEKDHTMRFLKKDHIEKNDTHSIIEDAEGCTSPTMTQIKELPKSLGSINMLSKDVVFIRNCQSLSPPPPQVEIEVFKVEELEHEVMTIDPQPEFKTLELEICSGGVDANLHDLSAKDHLVSEKKVASKSSLEESQCFVFNKPPSEAMFKVATPKINKEGVLAIKEFQFGIDKGGNKVGAKPTLEDALQSMELDETPNDEPKVSTCETMEEGVANLQDTQLHILKEVKELGDRHEMGILIGKKDVEVKSSSNKEQNSKLHEPPTSTKLVEKVVQETFGTPLVRKEQHVRVVAPLEEPPSILEFYDAFNEQLEFPTFDMKEEDVAKLEDFEMHLITNEKKVVGDDLLIQEASQPIVLEWAPIAKLEETPFLDSRQGTILKLQEFQLDIGDEENGVVAKSRVEETPQSLKFCEVPIEELEMKVLPKVFTIPLSKEERHVEVELAKEKEPWSTKLEKTLGEHVRLPILETKEIHVIELDKAQVPIIHKEKKVMAPQSNIIVEVPIEKPKEEFIFLNLLNIFAQQENQGGNDPMLDSEASQSNMLGEVPTKKLEGVQSMETKKVVSKVHELGNIDDFLMLNGVFEEKLANVPTNQMKEEVPNLKVSQLGIRLGGDLEEDIRVESSLKQVPQIKKVDMEMVLEIATVPHDQEGKHVDIQPILKEALVKLEMVFNQQVELPKLETKKDDVIMKMEEDQVAHMEEDKKFADESLLKEPLQSLVFEEALGTRKLEEMPINKINLEEIVSTLEIPQLGIGNEEKCVGIEVSFKKESQNLKLEKAQAIKKPNKEVVPKVIQIPFSQEEMHVEVNTNFKNQFVKELVDKWVEYEPTLETTLDRAYIDKHASMALDEEMGESEIEPKFAFEEPLITNDVFSEEFKTSIHGTKEHIHLEPMEQQSPMDEAGLEVEVEPILMEGLQSTIIIQKRPIQEDNEDLGIDRKNVAKLHKDEGPWEVDQTWEEFKRNWRKFKTKPNSLITSKMHQAREKRKNKAYKVVGLPWPPTRLSTSLNLEKDKR